MTLKSLQSLVLFSFIIISSTIFGLALRYIQVDLKISMSVVWIILFLVAMIKDEFFPFKNNLGRNKIIFSTNFGRELEYYTGMVFNIKNQLNTNLIQGGRYDNLLSNLGAKRKIPAVGAAINLNSYDN